VSEHVKKEVIRIFGIDEDRVKVIKSGIRGDLEPLPKKDKVFRVGYLAQLDRRKRVDLLIKAFKKSDLDELVIGGKGLDEGILKILAGGDKRIKFLGFIPDEELVNFYNSLDVFIFPTAIEGFGLPIVEAMACGKPVIVLDDAIIPWEVKRRCIIVENLDIVLGYKDYLERICKGIDIEGNYNWAKSHSWNKCIEEYEKLYEGVS
jgi:glycosyltransferase involved in cell wall biosynthesis